APARRRRWARLPPRRRRRGTGASRWEARGRAPLDSPWPDTLRSTPLRQSHLVALVRKEVDQRPGVVRRRGLGVVVEEREHLLGFQPVDTVGPRSELRPCVPGMSPAPLV